MNQDDRDRLVRIEEICKNFDKYVTPRIDNHGKRLRIVERTVGAGVVIFIGVSAGVAFCRDLLLKYAEKKILGGQ